MALYGWPADASTRCSFVYTSISVSLAIRRSHALATALHFQFTWRRVLLFERKSSILRISVSNSAEIYVSKFGMTR